MNGPAALPMQNADSTVAFVMTFFVCPAVVCESQVKLNTKLAAMVTDQDLGGLNDPVSSRKVMRTCYPDRK
jgi:hypothetical protein